LYYSNSEKRQLFQKSTGNELKNNLPFDHLLLLLLGIHLFVPFLLLLHRVCIHLVLIQPHSHRKLPYSSPSPYSYRVSNHCNLRLQLLHHKYHHYSSVEPIEDPNELSRLKRSNRRKISKGCKKLRLTTRKKLCLWEGVQRNLLVLLMLMLIQEEVEVKPRVFGKRRSKKRNRNRYRELRSFVWEVVVVQKELLNLRRKVEGYVQVELAYVLLDLG